MNSAVFCDLDGTLLPAASSEKLFISFLRSSNVIGMPQYLHALTRVLLTIPDMYAMFTTNKGLYTALDCAKISALASDFVSATVLPQLNDVLRQRLNNHKKSNHLTVLLTGTPDILAHPLARALAFDDVICSTLQQRSGRFTGKIIGLHPYGTFKANLVRTYAKTHDIDLSSSYGYANHHTDRFFLSLLGHPVACTPDLLLTRIARAHRWEIVAPAGNAQ